MATESRSTLVDFPNTLGDDSGDNHHQHQHHHQKGTQPGSARRRFQHLDLDKLRPARDPGVHPALRQSTSATSLTTEASKPSPQLRKPRSAADNRSTARQHKIRLTDDDTRRDSGLAPSLSKMPIDSNPGSANSRANTSPSRPVPSIVVQHESEHTAEPPKSSPRTETSAISFRTAPDESKHVGKGQDPDFEGIQTDIPTGQLDDPFSSEQLSFSNRGSILWSGEKAQAVFDRATSTRSMQNPVTSYDGASDAVISRSMSADETKLSDKVRSMYEHGDESGGPWSAAALQKSEFDRGESEKDIVTNLPSFGPTSPRMGYSSSLPPRSSSGMSTRRPASLIQKESSELAGGMEDWKDVESSDVDRYGFIKPRRFVSRGSSRRSSPPTRSPDVNSTPRQGDLSPVVETPGSPTASRKVQRSRSSKFNSHRLSVTNGSRPQSSASPSIFSNRSRTSNLSTAANRNRKWANEAGDMMTMEPGLTVHHSPTEDADSPAKAALERKREAKWAAMATKATTSNASKRTSVLVGGGTTFSFDTTSDKLISRTWKGIPDRWRASAWYSFLTSSAKRLQGRSYVPDEALVEVFHAYQEVPCSDDVQIDMDVPRTIGGHIMFRRRYRGGQRLLFRVLRALALHFPDTGYVQGMAGIVATLLCYYDEERAFVMSVRLWECRGLSFLYDAGFEGLMSVLGDFKKDWMVRLPVNKTLDELSISSTSFGTKWYLTLYGYSIPFAAQLRVWDVFMLLGDPPAPFTRSGLGDRARPQTKANFDILHAVAAALLDGLQEVILDADFENAMRALTQPVPVGKEDVLMRVALREYKEKKKRRRRTLSKPMTGASTAH